MTAFEIYINHQLVCIAGIDGFSLTNARLHWLVKDQNSKEEINLVVGGTKFPKSSKNLQTWLNQALAIGDEIKIKIIDVSPEEITSPTIHYL
jgi:hypothetical protein